jgi:hypothetical protein
MISCGWFDPKPYCPNSGSDKLVICLEVGEMVLFVAFATWDTGPIIYGVPPEGAVECSDVTNVSPVEFASTAIAAFPAEGDLSATQGCCVNGFTLIPLGSAPGEARRHS